ncbi:MAG: hypothetical protein E1N59_405 [Puniceicoccaceae bacterium 5H]|nr:MAG: hypothetical protein E1N59_405 [Puniceicoccaceae bacterium 5H]
MKEWPDPVDETDEEQPDPRQRVTPLAYALWRVKEYARLYSDRRKDGDELH